MCVHTGGGGGEGVGGRHRFTRRWGRGEAVQCKGGAIAVAVKQICRLIEGPCSLIIALTWAKWGEILV